MIIIIIISYSIKILKKKKKIFVTLYILKKLVEYKNNIKETVI